MKIKINLRATKLGVVKTCGSNFFCGDSSDEGNFFEYFHKSQRAIMVFECEVQLNLSLAKHLSVIEILECSCIRVHSIHEMNKNLFKRGIKKTSMIYL